MGTTKLEQKKPIGYTFSSLTEKNFSRVANLTIAKDVGDCLWDQSDGEVLSDDDAFIVHYLSSRMATERMSMMNEATLWARVHYQLLTLAETDEIKAWSEVSMEASFPSTSPDFTLSGEADGVLGWSTSGFLNTPYLVVVEAKRGLEAKDPRYQLYGQLIATAKLNSQRNNDEQHEYVLYGCYTVAENWTFVRAMISALETNHPSIDVILSREYSSRFETELIPKILKRIVREATTNTT
ncbi:MAG: hypothetical protein AAF639_38315 [Chloroflexota bacterium]